MRLSHKLSDHNKVVDSKHAGGPVSGAASFMHGPAQPAGPGAPAPAAQEPGLANGGCYADGGEYEAPSYGEAVKDRVKEIFGGGPKMPQGEQPKHQGRNIDDIVSEAETGSK